MDSGSCSQMTPQWKCPIAIEIVHGNFKLGECSRFSASGFNYVMELAKTSATFYNGQTTEFAEDLARLHRFMNQIFLRIYTLWSTKTRGKQYKFPTGTRGSKLLLSITALSFSSKQTGNQIS